MDFIHEYQSSETPTFILGVLSFPLLACILATLKTALHMKLYRSEERRVGKEC